MELPLISRTPNLSSVSFASPGSSSKQLCDFQLKKRKGTCFYGDVRVSVSRIRASVERSGKGIDTEIEAETSSSGGGVFTSPAMEVTTLNGGFNDAEFPVWDEIGAVVRLSYGIGIYGASAMALAGRFIGSLTGIDCMGGFQPTLDANFEGLGYATIPIMALLFILDDEVVKLSPHARAIRDVEDEELLSFFYGMSPWQFILVVAASSVGEELFYRAAVQGALSDIFLRGTDLVADARGVASLTGVLPPFVPFALTLFSLLCGCLSKRSYLCGCTSFIISLWP